MNTRAQKPTCLQATAAINTSCCMMATANTFVRLAVVIQEGAMKNAKTFMKSQNTSGLYGRIPDNSFHSVGFGPLKIIEQLTFDKKVFCFVR